MGSRKGSARVREISAFKAGLGSDEDGDIDRRFELEARRNREAEENREKVLRTKACESKNRYTSRGEAEAAVISCEEHGVKGLRVYQCRYCNGWHLTSKPLANASHPNWQRG